MKRLFSFLITFFVFLAPAGAATTEVTESITEETAEEMILSLPETGEEGNPAEAYIARIMPHRQVLRIPRPSGLRLEEPDRSLYNALRVLISNVASGAQSSTEFSIPYGDVFQNTFTAAELDIEKIIVDGSITEEAMNAAKAAMLRNRGELHPGTAVRCVMTDSPYELYWYDKTEGHGARISYLTSGYSATTGTITVEGDILIRMSVSRDYAVQSVSAEGGILYAEYEADPAYGTAVQAAAENAAAILAAHRDKSDEEKLAAYRDAICALTDYNHEASDSDPYGDPWQLVWVFDGKPNTKVVCEGYAKAFQYLCDLGTSEATAITVQGRTSGPHMWNIVTIGGHNYLADLTNCDAGYDLFLRGSTDGSAAAGYTIDHGRGTIRYRYNDDLVRDEEELTLYRMDYADWKTVVEKVPEIRMSSDVLFPGYAAVVRTENEDPDFLPSALRIHCFTESKNGETEEETTEELATEDGIWYLSTAGTYTFTVIRDGVESMATEPMTLAETELPAGPGIRLPAGAEIEAEAFAGDENITCVEAEDCILRTGAFAGGGVRMARLAGNCTVEPGAFEPTVILCVDHGSEWMEEYRFLVSEPVSHGDER